MTTQRLCKVPLKNKMTTKELYKKNIRYYLYLLLIFMIGMMIFVVMAMYFKMQYNQEKEYAQLLCLTSNKQSELIQTMYPVYVESQCNTFKGILNNTNLTDYICKTFKDVKMPDKLNCKDI